MPRALVIGILVSALAVSSCSSDETSGSSDSSSSTTSTLPASRDVQVEFVYGPPDWPWTLDSPPGEPFLVHGVSNYTGDWTATSTYASVQQTVDDRFGGFSLGVLDGEVTGCGSGQFLFMDAFASPSSTGGWLIVPGFGTRDLASLSGSGTWEGAETPGGDVGAGEIRGSVICTGEGTPPEGSWFYGTTDAGSVPVSVTATRSAPTIAWENTATPPDGSPARPIIHSDGYATVQLAGAWAGNATASLATATGPSDNGGFAEAMVMRFSGSVVGCGEGSFVVTVLDQFEARDAAGVRSWEIAPGLGTGDLSGATGFGTGTVSAGGGTGTFEGSMSCHA